MSERHFYALFASAADRFGPRTAIDVQRRDGITSVSYDELRDFAERTSGWLRARGVAAGDRIAILAENDDRWCGVYLGILRAGAIAVPLDTAYGASQIATVLRDSGAVGVFASHRFGAALDDAIAALDAGPGRPFAALIHGEAPGAPCIADDIRSTPRDTTPLGAGEDGAAVILYTSGTTSDPKGVVLTHDNLIAERTGAFTVVRVDERDVVLSVLPLFHALAQMANLLLPLTVGARVVFLESVNTTELTRALRERDITAFVCVPQFFYLLHQRIEHELAALPLPARTAARGLAAACLRLRLWTGINAGRLVFARVHRSLGPRIRLLVTGGARFDPEVNRALYALGFTVRQAYGLTECSGAATLTGDGDPEFTSVGRPLPGVEVRIGPREAGSPTAEARDGEVLVRGPIVMRGYYNRPDQNAITLADGWLHTGDLGYTDPRGRLYVTGRSKEVIVLGSGKNIYPEEIEAHYQKSPFIEEICVAGLARPGDPSAERLHALIRPDSVAMRARGAVNIRELLRFEVETLSVQLPAHKRILGYDVTLDPLPRTTTPKLKRFEIERRLAAMAAASASAAVAPGGEAWPDHPRTAAILDLVREGLPAGVVLRPEAHLELDLGLDSMERVELLVHVTGALGITIADEDAQGIHTAGQLVAACVARAGGLEDDAERVMPWVRMLEQPPPAEAIEQLARPKRKRAILLFAVLKVLYGVCRLTTGIRADGREHLPVSGPYLISPNHQSYIDAFLVVAALPFRTFRDLFFVGAAEYFETPVTKWLASALNVIPVDPDANLVGAMQAGAHGLRRGKILVLFPEGERSIDGTVKTFRKGAAILSHHVGVPVVPVAIDGAWDVWARGRSFNWSSVVPFNGTRLRVTFGPSIAAPPTADYQAHTEILRSAVARMWTILHRERVPDTGSARETGAGV